jgi:GT2 family glycosyltransferase
VFFEDEKEESTRKRSLIREFLAQNKYAICYRWSNSEELDDSIIRVESNHQLLLAIQNILVSDSARKNEHKDNRQKEPESTDCNQRHSEIQKRIQTHVLPRVSVIILTFNNLELTKVCLSSVIERSDYANLEIIVVDNASTDGTIDYLTEFQRRHSSVKIIANRYNVGFAAGNNLGMAAATGEYLVLLNNDTVVTEGWVLTLLHHLMDHSDIGLLGAVTNHIGNEAQVKVEYAGLDQMPERSRAYTLTHMGELLFLRTVAFFCVMMPRSTYTRCGPISEEYGVGFFEDDDYCRKVEKLGLKIACAEDVFIHHHLSASFNKLREKERRALFDRNRAIYEKKWGPWTPHRYRY